MAYALHDWRMRYERAGIAAIPLRRSSKKPLASAWQTTPPWEQWRAVGPAFRGNIGVRAGNGLVIADGDSPQSVANLKAFFAGLGLSLPIVATPSGGRHFYLLVEDVPYGIHAPHLDPHVGAGELRVGNAYVAAPCSIVNSVRYRFVSGSPEDIARLRPLRWHDVAPLIGPTASVGGQKLDRPPVRLLRRDAPAIAIALLGALQSARKGQPIHRYRSRSEAEAAVVCDLVLAGKDYAEIAAMFEEWQPGHYREMEKHRQNYLQRTYRKVLAVLSADPQRIEVARAYHDVSLPSLLSPADLAAYRAYLAIAWQFGSLEFAASVRDIAMHTGRSLGSVVHASRRLAQCGFVRRVRRADPEMATVWRIAIPTTICVSDVAKMNTSHNYGGAVVHGTSTGTSLQDTDHVLWSASPFSARSAQIYAHLNDHPNSAHQIAQLAGVHRSTAARILRTLQQRGLAATTSNTRRGEPTGWIRGSARLDDVAEKLRVHRTLDRRREQFAQERETWHERCQGATNAKP